MKRDQCEFHFQEGPGGTQLLLQTVDFANHKILMFRFVSDDG